MSPNNNCFTNTHNIHIILCANNINANAHDRIYKKNIKKKYGNITYNSNLCVSFFLRASFFYRSFTAFK